MSAPPHARYVEFDPPPELARHVACFWIFEGQDAGEDQRIVPDGRCELIVHYGEPYVERGAGQQPRVLFAGQLTRPLHIRAPGPAGVMGARFTPAGAWAYIGGPLSDFTDQRVPMGLPELADRMRAAKGDAARLACIASHVWEAVGPAPSRVDPAIEAAVAAIHASEGRLPLEHLEQATGLSARALQRRFAQVVGVSPRMLAAVIRFRRVFAALEEASVETWSDAAQAAGYFDHPQMARDFRRFLGCTPSQFMAGERGLATSVANLQAGAPAGG